MKNVKKLLYRGVALMGAVVMFITTPAFAAESHHGKGNGKHSNVSQDGISDADREYWENVEWESFDIGAYEAEANELEAMQEAEAGISLMYLEGAAGTWIQASDGRWWYKHTDGSYTTSSWEKINGKWYYFDAAGWMYTGWLNDNGTWYYLDPVSGAMQTGWILVKGRYYYCNSSGAMQTGWVYTNSKWYYCDETNGDWIDNTGTKMIQEAFKYVGGKYVYGGNSLTTGVDCSGYVQQISKIYGITTPRTSSSQYASSAKVSYSNLQPGDLVFFSSSSDSTKVTHVAFYVGRINGQDDMIVHAANSNDGIIISKMRSNIVGYGTYWR